ncbi:hypothetical protein BDA99DRAFT_558303 [Phascolomyces articulosus]|uniref:EamA domain-containing protein n=1 Tax=Phascolomyces articulosus TaxID=60185 RepID=A0AAD5K3T1_9FUNG|nr:hypothetical protein BDA99DRAFT_558303 [Phascolomyces articulosus]
MSNDSLLQSNKIGTENFIQTTTDERAHLLTNNNYSQGGASSEQLQYNATGDGLSTTETPIIHESSSLLPTSKREALGLLSISISTLGVSTGATFVKLASKIFSTSQILVARFLFQGTLSLIGCYCLGIHPLVQSKDGRKWVFIRGFVGSLSSMTLYYSLRFLPLADATVIMNTHPMFSAIFAAIMLGEPFRWFERFCTLICIIGATLVTKPTFLFAPSASPPPLELLPPTDNNSTMMILDNSDNVAIIGGYTFNPRTIGIISALLAAMTSAAAYVSVRIAGSRAHFLNHMLSLSVISILLNLLNFQGFVMPDEVYPYELLGAMAVTTFIGQCFLNRGLQLAPSGIGTLMCTNEVWLSFLFGVMVFKEYPDFLSVLGAIMIMSVSISLGYKKWNANR